LHNEPAHASDYVYHLRRLKVPGVGIPLDDFLRDRKSNAYIGWWRRAHSRTLPAAADQAACSEQYQRGNLPSRWRRKGFAVEIFVMLSGAFLNVRCNEDPCHLRLPVCFA